MTPTFLSVLIPRKCPAGLGKGMSAPGRARVGDGQVRLG